MSATENRKYDVIVWGATGFTGALVAEYLVERYGTDGDVAWAIAGRNADKLAALKKTLGSRADTLDVLTADSHDVDSLDQLTRATRVVCTTVGPYAKYGSELVAACARNGTHYCDLAGEVPWMREMIDTHSSAAEASGARIVHCCGFDSIPSDMGVYFAQREARERFGEPFVEIALLVRAIRGAASGGTVASLLGVVEAATKNRDTARVVVHPYSLNPDGERQGPDGRDQRGSEYNDIANAWTAPFVMAQINTKVVRRSNALLGFPYGREFRYSESTMTGSGLPGWLKASAVSLGLGGFMLAAAVGPLRSLLNKTVLPQPGEGPDEKAREAGFFNLLLYGKRSSGEVVRTRVTGDRDPGYGSTSKMLAEAAVCLAKDQTASAAGGFWTPASALGDSLITRLEENAGLSFEFDV
ncbi:MAG: saccharopine dehydrogenase NADP-binding domain-containing protein [Pseudomonadota bacterium]